MTAAGAWIARVSHWFWCGVEGKRTPWVRRVLGTVFAFLVPIPIVLILLFRFVPIPFSAQMIVRLVTLRGVHYAWSGDISPELGRAVIGSEDQQFCFHHGFDWKSIDKALAEHKRHPSKPLRGASTLSQQTARTVFLTPVRSWVRKGLEAYITVLMETLWPKKRILTVYLNLVDWGNGNFGAEAASQVYFGKPASALSPSQAARLAAVLPDPTKWSAAKPGPYVRRRTAAILGRMHEVTRDGLDFCVKD